MLIWQKVYGASDRARNERMITAIKQNNVICEKIVDIATG